MDGHGQSVDPNIAYKDNSMWNGVGFDPGPLPEELQNPYRPGPVYSLDPHVNHRWDETSGQEWRYPDALSG